MGLMPSDRNGNSPSHEEDSGYLYHKQPRNVPRRHSGSHQNTDDMNRRFTERNVARETLWRNIRMLVFVVIGMLLFLGLAFHIAKKNWIDKQKRIRQEGQKAIPPAFKERIPLPTPEDSAQPMKQEASEKEKTKAQFLMQRARAFQVAGNTKEAIQRFQDALELWDAVPEGWLLLARSYVEQNNLIKAREAYTHAIQYDPGNIELINEQAMLYLQHGQTDKALSMLTQAVASDPSYADSYINLSLCYLSMRNTKDAEAVLMACLKRFPDNIQALKEMGYIKASTGDYEGTLNVLKHAIKIKPDWVPLYFDAAATCALMGKETDAFLYLQQALAYSTPRDIRAVLKQPAFASFLKTEKGMTFIQQITARLTVSATQPDPSATNKVQTDSSQSSAEPL